MPSCSRHVTLSQKPVKAPWLSWLSIGFYLYLSGDSHCGSHQAGHGGEGIASRNCICNHCEYVSSQIGSLRRHKRRESSYKLSKGSEIVISESNEHCSADCFRSIWKQVCKMRYLKTITHSLSIVDNRDASASEKEGTLCSRILLRQREMNDQRFWRRWQKA